MLAILNFVHPALLGLGAALVSVPILIHLLNRRRFRIVDWAAMELLRLVDRKNRRRLQLEDLLILLLRCLAVLLLSLLIARMVLSKLGVLSRLGGARTERVVIVDDSPSMDLRQGNRRVFARATAALGEYVRKLAHGRPGDTLTVILTSSPDQPVVNGQILGGERTESVANLMETLKCSSVPARFEQTLLTLRRTVENEPSVERAVYVVSDFRRHDWLPEGKEGGVPKHLAALAGKVSDMVLVNVGQTVASDLAILDVRSDERNVVKGVPAPFLITVANRGTQEADGAAVAVTSDGVPAARVNVPTLGPGAVQTFSAPVAFARAGPVSLEAELTGGDQLTMDDRRGYAGTAETAVRLLVVDGEPDPDPFRCETFYLRRALAPPGESVSGMSVEVADESEFDPRMLDNVHVLFLCNVYRLTEERLRAIAEWVRRGGGLVIFPGDQVDGGYWNETARTAAPGLLPLKFVEMAGDQSEREWQVLRLSRPEHPVLQAFTGDNNPFLQRVKIFRYWNLEPAADATVLATLGNGRPALVETLYGTGRVLTFATAADAEWNNWPSDPSYVVTLQQVARCAARAASQTRSLAAGQPLRHEVSPALYRNEGRLFAPGAEESELLRATASTNLAMINFESAPLKQAGIWSLALTSHEGEEVRVPFAVNIEAAESEMEAADPRELLRRAGDDRIRFIEGPEIPTPEEAGGTRSELTRLLAALLIAALLIEQGLAWWFGKRRRA